MRFNPKTHILGKVYDLSQDNMNALIAEFETLENENAHFRAALERIEDGQLCRYHQCDCGSSPEDIARAALSGGKK